eukprot:RCo009756
MAATTATAAFLLLFLLPKLGPSAVVANPTCGASQFSCPTGYTSRGESSECSSSTCSLSDCCVVLYSWKMLTDAADFGARVAHCSVILGSQLLVIAGRDSHGTYLSDIWASADGLSWTNLTRSGFWARAYFSCAVLGSQVLVMGGCNSTHYMNDVWSSTTGADWTPLGKSSFTPRAWHGSAVLLSRVWVVAGYTMYDVDVNDVW